MQATITTEQTQFWALGDTHLSFGKARDMTRFSETWIDHAARIAALWREKINSNDVILLAGDISWAQTVAKVEADLAWLSALPGRKILLRGNHDHWWKDIAQVRKILEPRGFYALEGDSIELDGVIVCGAMGHVAPEDPYYVENSGKDRYRRELGRLENALKDAQSRRVAEQPVILMMHYPPFTSEGKPTAYVEIISHYRPALCIYGHLHRSNEWEVAQNGLYNGVRYLLVAADYLDMNPYPVWPLEYTRE